MHTSHANPFTLHIIPRGSPSNRGRQIDMLCMHAAVIPIIASCPLHARVHGADRVANIFLKRLQCERDIHVGVCI
jgi:hypothetical protein